MSEHDRYSSPLAERYASKAMLRSGRRPSDTASGVSSGWRSPRRSRRSAFRFPTRRSSQMRAHLDDIDFDGGRVVREAISPRRDGAHPRVRRRRAGGARLHSLRRDERVRHRQRRSDSDAARAPAAAREGRSASSARSPRSPANGGTSRRSARRTSSRRSPRPSASAPTTLAAGPRARPRRPRSPNRHASLPRRERHDGDAGELPRDLRRRSRKGARARPARHRGHRIRALDSRFRARRTRASSTRRSSGVSPASPRAR